MHLGILYPYSPLSSCVSSYKSDFIKNVLTIITPFILLQTLDSRLFDYYPPQPLAAVLKQLLPSLNR